MAIGVSRVFLVGTIVGKPLYFPKQRSGYLQVYFTLATEDRYVALDGKLVRDVDHHKIDLLLKEGSDVPKYLVPGAVVFVEGVLKYRKTPQVTKDGNEVWRHYVKITKPSGLKFLPGGPAPDIEEEPERRDASWKEER